MYLDYIWVLNTIPHNYIYRRRTKNNPATVVDACKCTSHCNEGKF